MNNALKRDRTLQAHRVRFQDMTDRELSALASRLALTPSVLVGLERQAFLMTVATRLWGNG